jgi:hypothetical protein
VISGINKAVFYEQYIITGVNWKGDVSEISSTKAAWFKDLDGNILCAVSQ